MYYCSHNYNSIIPLRVLNDRIAMYVQMFTLYASVRPFGCSLIFGGKDVHGPQLFMVEPSGISYVSTSQIVRMYLEQIEPLHEATKLLNSQSIALF